VKTCTEIVLSGKRCREVQDAVGGVHREDGRCYYHGKKADGLTTGAESIISVEEEDEV
jgi:hypothetical protein